MSDPFLASVYLKNTGSADWSVDGSSTPVEFTGGVPSGYSSFYVHRALLYLRDGSGFRAGHFASLGAELTNGCDFELVRFGATYDMLDGLPVKSNGDFGRVNYDVDLKSWGAGDDVLLARWSFDRFGGPIKLAGENSYFVWRINDNLAGVTEATIALQGRLE